MYIAHKNDEDKNEQSLIDHLTCTAKLAGEFAVAFNNREYGYIIGCYFNFIVMTQMQNANQT
jgi:hypothetical protein